MHKSYLGELLEQIAVDRKKHPVRWFISDLKGWFFVTMNSVRICIKKIKL